MPLVPRNVLEPVLHDDTFPFELFSKLWCGNLEQSSTWDFRNFLDSEAEKIDFSNGFWAHNWIYMLFTWVCNYWKRVGTSIPWNRFFSFFLELVRKSTKSGKIWKERFSDCLKTTKQVFVTIRATFGAKKPLLSALLACRKAKNHFFAQLESDFEEPN